jgi:ATP-dependent Clp protease, protease subunit
LKKELYQIIAFHTGQTFEKVWQDSDRDCWLKAEEAKEYGLIDEVLVSRTKGFYASKTEDKE